MWPDRVSNPGPPTYESGALPIALRGPAQMSGEELNKHSCFRSDPIVCFMPVSCSPCNHLQLMRQ